MQQTAVFLIGVFVFSYVAWRTYKLLAGKNGKNSPCAGCHDSGCALRDVKKKSC